MRGRERSYVPNRVGKTNTEIHWMAFLLKYRSLRGRSFAYGEYRTSAYAGKRTDAATVRQMWEGWGEMSLLRCLAVNDPDAGPPRTRQFKGVFQLISDVWHVEVLRLGRRPRELELGPAAATTSCTSSATGPTASAAATRAGTRTGTGGFDPEARGAQLGGRGQLVSVADPTWTRYGLLMHVAFPSDTSHETKRRPVRLAGPAVLEPGRAHGSVHPDRTAGHDAPGTGPVGGLDPGRQPSSNGSPRRTLVHDVGLLWRPRPRPRGQLSQMGTVRK